MPFRIDNDGDPFSFSVLFIGELVFTIDEMRKARVVAYDNISDRECTWTYHALMETTEVVWPI
jgi:hypothetical protein